MLPMGKQEQASKGGRILIYLLTMQPDCSNQKQLTQIGIIVNWKMSRLVILYNIHIIESNKVAIISQIFVEEIPQIKNCWFFSGKIKF